MSKAFKVEESVKKSLKQKVLMKMSSPLSQERFTPYENKKEGPDRRATPKGTPKNSKTKVKLCAMNAISLDTSKKEKEKRKSFFKKKKGLMDTWEDLDYFSSKEEDKEANLCLMLDIALKDEDDKEVIPNGLNNLQMAYQELFSNSLTLSIGYKDLEKKFSKLSKDLKEEKAKDLYKSNALEVNEQLREKVIDLKQSLAKFVNGSGNLKKDYSGKRHKSWYLHSGCSRRMKKERIDKIGKHPFPSIDSFLFVEGLKHNQLSISQLCDSGYDNSLYKINLIDLTNHNVTCLVSINTDQWTWHKKLRYASLRLISKLKRHNLVRGLLNLEYKHIFYVMHARK
ncbi:hypothetical protein CR513_34631, partial [Mucuna pruriens]